MTPIHNHCAMVAMKPNRPKSPENIARAQALRAQGLSNIAIGKVFGIGETSIRCWLNPDYRKAHIAKAALWQKVNRETVNANQRERTKRRTRAEKDKHNAYQKHRYATSPKARETLRRLSAKYRGTEQGYLGAKVRIAVLSYANKFPACYMSLMRAVSGMTQDEFIKQYQGEGHFDHIVPVCSFDLTNPEHLVRCNHHTNLRLVSQRENQMKHDDGKLGDVMHLPWVGTQAALDEAQAFISKRLAMLSQKRGTKQEPEPVAMEGGSAVEASPNQALEPN